MTHRRELLCATTMMLVCMLVSCERQTTTSEPLKAGRLASLVSGTAAMALQPNGQFLPDRAVSADGAPIISEKRAADLAMAYIRSFGRSFHSAWEQQRGTAIDLASLRVGARIYFAHTPYGAFPPGFHPALRRTYGPYYLVTLESNGAPTIMMAVSAYNTDTGIDANGLIQLPKLNGMGFLHAGIPLSGSQYAFVSPEQAVDLAFTAGHARVSTPPELVLSGHTTSPLLAKWHVTLEHAVNVKARGGNAVRAANEILVGPRNEDRFQRADDDQPSSVSGKAPRVLANGTLGPVGDFVVPIAAGRSVKHTVVSLGGQ